MHRLSPYVLTLVEGDSFHLRCVCTSKVCCVCARAANGASRVERRTLAV